MDLNELQSVQSRERQTDSLQQLRASFYRDAADYIGELEAERDSAAQRADDPWNSPEVGRLNDDIDTAKGTVEAIYERRVGKIVKMASLAAADMPTDDEGLTDEEQALFDQLVAAIEQNRKGVFAILDGEDPPVDPTEGGQLDTGAAPGPPESATPGESSSEPDGEPREVPPDVQDPPGDSATTDPTDSVSSTDDSKTDNPKTEDPPTQDQHVGAADLMGGEAEPETGTEPERSGQPVHDGGAVDTQATDSTGGPADTQSPTEAGPDSGVSSTTGDRANAAGSASETSDVTTDTAEAAAPAESVGNAQDAQETKDGEDDESAETTTVDRSMVRITDDVGPIYGVEGREYDLTANDVVTLPEANVGPLLKQGAAERLD